MCLVALHQRESEFAVFDCLLESWMKHFAILVVHYFLQQLTLTDHKEPVSALTFSTPPSSSSPTLLCSASADSVLLWDLEQEDSEGIHNNNNNNNGNNNQSNRTSRRNPIHLITKCSLILQSQSFLVPSFSW